tara:strand:+ start:1741 stop:2337 length:597 start_codon:yes stop_codon:yes gene_type:complete
MGYTHYWYTRKEIPTDKWKAFTDDCKELLDSDAAEGIVWSKEDKIFPYITDEYCNFNGIGDNGHETFAMCRYGGLKQSDGESFDFCKTAHKPYDKYVVDVLILAEKHFGDLIRVKSDGHWPDVKRDREHAKLQNHMFDVAFTVESTNKAEDVTNEELLKALAMRWASLCQEFKDDLHKPYGEAFGYSDSYDVREEVSK